MRVGPVTTADDESPRYRISAVSCSLSTDGAAVLLKSLRQVLERKGLLPAACPSRSETGARTVLLPISASEDPVRACEDAESRAGPLSPRTDVILRTSGSTTGTGSLIEISADALAASARATHERLGGPGTWVLALPAHHVAGLQVLVRSLLAGTDPVVVDTTGGFRPGALTTALLTARQRAGTQPVYVSVVPTQLARVLDEGPGSPAVAALADAGAVLVGGAAVPAASLERARAAGIRVVTTYGMSETGGGCVYDGVPLTGVGLRIEDPDEAGAGRIVFSGPVLAERCTGVVGPGASTGTVLREGARRELVTTDRGRLVDGRLEVLGRVDDVIITGGVKVEPRRVEEALVRLPGVAEACVVGVADATWGSAVVALVVPAAGQRLEPVSVRAAARAVLDGAHTPKHVLVVDGLALRGPGKVDRRAAAALARGRLG